MKLSHDGEIVTIAMSHAEAKHLYGIVNDWLLSVREEDEEGERLDVAEIIRDWIDEEFE